MEEEDWSPRVHMFSTHMIDRQVAEQYRDEHVARDDMMYDSDAVAIRDPSYVDRPRYSAFHAPMSSPSMHELWNGSRTFRPISRGYGGLLRESPRSQELPKPKSRSSSRAASLCSGVNLDWLGDFVKKFADDASSREKRDADERKRLVEAARQRKR